VPRKVGSVGEVHCGYNNLLTVCESADGTWSGMCNERIGCWRHTRGAFAENISSKGSRLEQMHHSHSETSIGRRHRETRSKTCEYTEGMEEMR